MSLGVVASVAIIASVVVFVLVVLILVWCLCCMGPRNKADPCDCGNCTYCKTPDRVDTPDGAIMVEREETMPEVHRSITLVKPVHKEPIYINRNFVFYSDEIQIQNGQKPLTTKGGPLWMPHNNRARTAMKRTTTK